jgi:nucleotide-binding universal stress UspA family protein
MTSTLHPVVAGVDGSPGSDAATRWAANEAARRHLPLRLVYAYRWPPNYGAAPMYAAWPLGDPLEIKRAAQELATQAAAKVRELYPALEVDAASIEGSRVQVMLAESEHAALLVLGSRELGAWGSAVLGSVGAGVSARAACPVVVVRGPAGNADEDARVVAAVDGGETSPQVLEFAFEHASRAGIGVRAVLCWWAHLYQPIGWRTEDYHQAQNRAYAWLSEALAGFREKYPDVPVTSVVLEEHAVNGLVGESTGAHLLVVGSHGRHALSGTLLGSVSQGVLHHASCPVAVLPCHH